MKKFTLLLWSLILSTSLFAQLPNGSVAPNFTATDLNGNTWNLYDLLDQGKSVVIVFSATWSGPDWNYSNTNITEQYHQLHGPAGDNSSMVLWVEGDPSTNAACLMGSVGCVGGSQGDFTAGKSYPFIEDFDGSLAATYQIAYFPTIFRICSDKISKVVGQVPLPVLEAETAACPVITSTSKLIIGAVVKDYNANCLVDNGEPALANWGVTATGQNSASYSTVSNGNGNFKMWVDSTNSPYTLTFTPPNALWTPCAPPPTVVFSAADTAYVFHPATASISCPQLTTQIGVPFLRRCGYNHFSVDVCNDGTDTAEDAFVVVSLPPPEFLPIIEATLPYTILDTGVYRFELGDILLGDCVHIGFKAAVLCDTALIGETLCFEAHAFPDSICTPPNAAWNGASVAVSATCNSGVPGFNISNVGTAPMLEQLEFIVVEDDVMRSNGVFQLNVGETMPVPVQDNGSTWRVEALQVANHPVNGNPSAALEGCTVLNNFSTGFLLAYSVYDPSPAYDIECMPVIGSWDPNDKMGLPLGISDEHLIAKNTPIDYLIRFQNTGNDTAFNIVVRDTLSFHVDPSSIRLGASSHPYDFVVEQGNILIFSFNNIQLVDSVANEPASHGFLRYKIAQKPNLADGTEINNRAGIYFDFNPVVMTNNTQHKIGEVPHVSSLLKYLPASNKLSVYPNPLNGSMLLHTMDELPEGTRWVLYDFSGKRLDGGNMNGKNASIGTSLKTAGLYYVQFRTKDGRLLGGATIRN